MGFGETLNGYGWATYAWVFGLAALGCIADGMRRERRGQGRKTRFAAVLGDLSIALLAGFVTFLGGQAAHLPPETMAALVALAGHMGSRLLFIIEAIATEYLRKRVTSLVPKDPADTQPWIDCENDKVPQAAEQRRAPGSRSAGPPVASPDG